MKKKFHLILLPLTILLTAEMIHGPAAVAEEFHMQGWGIDDPYNRLYDVGRFEKCRGRVIGFKVEPPMPGMSDATILTVKNGSRIFDVHICPTWFAAPGHIGVNKGDRIKIKGCWARISGKNVFMAAKIKKDNYFEFKVRLTKNGKPFWAMTPEELVSEIIH